MRTLYRVFAGLLVVVMASACASIAPPDLPAQLEHTPGPFVSVTERHYRNDTFLVAYPDGWRVITSPATEPPYAIFANPNNTALMVFGVEAVDPLPQLDIAPENLRTDIRTISLGDDEVFAVLIGLDRQWDTLLPLFELMLDTLRPNTQ